MKPCDKRSFILGMITAFSECVVGGCKRLALSPPMTAQDYEKLFLMLNRLAEREADHVSERKHTADDQRCILCGTMCVQYCDRIDLYEWKEGTQSSRIIGPVYGKAI